MSLLDYFKTDEVKTLWNETAAADDYSPLPSGTYEMEALRGKEFRSKSGTPGYKITWKVKGGDHDGRLVWQDFWFTKAAMPMTKRDLGKLGITADRMELTDGIIARVQLVERTRDDGITFNDVKRFDVLRVEADPFAPVDSPIDLESIKLSPDGEALYQELLNGGSNG